MRTSAAWMLRNTARIRMRTLSKARTATDCGSSADSLRIPCGTLAGALR